MAWKESVTLVIACQMREKYDSCRPQNKPVSILNKSINKYFHVHWASVAMPRAPLRTSPTDLWMPLMLKQTNEVGGHVPFSLAGWDPTCMRRMLVRLIPLECILEFITKPPCQRQKKTRYVDKSCALLVNAFFWPVESFYFIPTKFARTQH